MKKETAKRVIALLICVWMTVSMLPTVAMATEGADAYTNGDDSGVTALDDESGGIPRSPTRISRSYPATPTP